MRGPRAILRIFISSLREFDWSELRYLSASGYWPFSVYVVSCAGSALLVTLIAGLALGPGLNQTWQTAQSRSSALTIEYSALASQLHNWSASNISVLSQQAPAMFVHHHLLTAESMPGIVDLLRVLTASRGIAVSQLRPQERWQTPGQHAFAIELRMQADRHQLSALLGDLSELPLALTINQLDWHQVSSDTRLTLFVLVTASDSEGQGIGRAGAILADVPPPGVRSADPVGAVEAARGTADDTYWRRVALIQQGNRYLEVLRDAHGATRRLEGKVQEDGL